MFPTAQSKWPRPRPRFGTPSLRLVRAPGVFSAFADILAAWFIGAGGTPVTVLPLVALASGLIYSGGMALNDCFDYSEDRHERPERPLVVGALSRRAGWLIGWTLLAAGVAVTGLVGIATMAVAVGLAVLVVIYDAVASRTPAGPWVMGGCRYGNWLLALTAGGLALEELWLPLPVLGYVLAVTWLARDESRACNPRAPIQAGVFATASAMSLLALHVAGLLPHAAALLVLPGLALALGALRRTARAYTPERVQSTVRALLLGIIPLDALLAAGAGALWGGLAVLALLLPSRLLARRMHVT